MKRRFVAEMKNTHIKIIYVLTVLSILSIIMGCGGGGGGDSSGAVNDTIRTGSVTLQWDVPQFNAPYCINAAGHNPDQVSCEGAGGTWVTNDPLQPAVTGYIVYYGMSSGNYSDTVEIKNAKSAVINDLASGTWYFAVTAYNEIGNESDYSDELAINVL